MELFARYRKKERAMIQAYNIICDIEASSHGFVFGDEARKRLEKIGLAGEALYKKQIQLKKDPRGTRESLEQLLMNS